MDNKTLATILLRVLSLNYLLYGVFYTPYLLFSASFNSTFIISSLSILTYVGTGMCLFLLSKPLAALAVKGLDRNSISPPPPPRFEN
jgi:hypothetical protein